MKRAFVRFEALGSPFILGDGVGWGVSGGSIFEDALHVS
jgi:hypothetical protein